MDPLFVIARLDLARYYDHHGNPETAEQLFREALEVHPDSFDGHIHYGEFLYSKVSHGLSFQLWVSRCAHGNPHPGGEYRAHIETPKAGD